jgi:LysM repeat protein
LHLHHSVFRLRYELLARRDLKPILRTPSRFSSELLAALMIGAILILWSLPAQAVSEESIGGSPRRPAVQNTGPAEDESPAPATMTINPERSSAPEDQTSITPPAPAAPTVRVQQPRATFPYTLRPGDNLGSIAEEFGVSVADLRRLNHVASDIELVAGETFRIPNPGLARERDLTAQVNQLTAEEQAIQDRAHRSEAEATQRRGEAAELTSELNQAGHDLRRLSLWRRTTYVLAAVAILMFGAMVLAMLDWWFLRNRFRAVAEMNESLRRLDYRYRSALAKAELRLQELYGRRRRGLHDGQERPRLAEEAEIERLSQELKTVLETHLARLGSPGASARRARWEERVSAIGSPIEVRPVRR